MKAKIMQAELVKIFPAKVRGTRKARDPDEMKETISALAESVKLIGNSFSKPHQPHSVPRDAPDQGEWNAIAKDIYAMIPAYKDLFEKGKNTQKKTGKGGLDQYIYLDSNMTKFLNGCGILGPHKIPVDNNAGGLGILTRSVLTSAIISYIEAKGLKHTVERKYVLPDEFLNALYGVEKFIALKDLKPKPKKKKKKPSKPREPTPKIKYLERDGETKLHFSFDAVPTICGEFIIALPPRNVSQEFSIQIETVRKYLKSLTSARQANRKDQARADKEKRDADKLRNSVVPVQILTLQSNTAGAMANMIPIGNFNGLVTN